MPGYCLDSDTLIQARRGPYGMDIVPAFWDWLDQQSDEGTIFTSEMVYQELKDFGDELAEWVKARHPSPLFVTPSRQAQEIYSQVADFVSTTEEYPFKPEHRAQFLKGADAWVIAQAMEKNAAVVTMEVAVDPSSTKVKIPNICAKFGVDCLNIYQLLRALNAQFVLS